MDKKDNAKMLDPQRFQITKNMSVMPGSPGNGDPNNPMNVTSIATPPVTAPSIYGDFTQNYAQMGDGVVNPQSVAFSGNNQQNVIGRGGNMFPFNTQMQPPAEMEEMLEGGRQSFEGKQRGVFTQPFLGISGQPATPAPGGGSPTPQQSAATIPLVGNSTAAVPPAGGMNMKSGKRGK